MELIALTSLFLIAVGVLASQQAKGPHIPPPPSIPSEFGTGEWEEVP